MDFEGLRNSELVGDYGLDYTPSSCLLCVLTGMRQDTRCGQVKAVFIVMSYLAASRKGVCRINRLLVLDYLFLSRCRVVAADSELGGAGKKVGWLHSLSRHRSLSQKHVQRYTLMLCVPTSPVKNAVESER